LYYTSLTPTGEKRAPSFTITQEHQWQGANDSGAKYTWAHYTSANCHNVLTICSQVRQVRKLFPFDVLFIVGCHAPLDGSPGYSKWFSEEFRVL
jgi:hypothetical protein